MKCLITFIFLLIHQIAFTQSTTEIYLSDILEQAILSNDHNVSIHVANASIDNLKDIQDPWGSSSKESIGEYLKSNFQKLPSDTSGYLIIDKKLNIHIDKLETFLLSDLHFTNVTIEIDEVKNLFIKNCHFDTLTIQLNNLTKHGFINENYISQSQIESHSIQEKAPFWFHSNVIDYSELRLNNARTVEILGNSFKIHPMKIDAGDSAFYKINNKLIDYNDNRHPMWLELVEVEEVIIWMNKNIDLRDQYEFEALTITGSVNNLKILENILHIPLQFIDLTIKDRLEIIKNEFKTDKAFGLYRVLLPELLIDIDWDQFDKKLYILTDASSKETDHGFWEFGVLPYFGESLIEMEYNDRRRTLLSTYSKFYIHFKNSGDVGAFNAIYKDIQDLNTLYYEYLAKQNSSVQDIFRWRLNQLIRFYTDYGTNPVKAVVISIYLILAFAIFYFFFPSEWDKESKAKTIEHLTLAIKKNSVPFFPALFRAIYFLFLSLVNAITLSLNSFVTLGFGTIPTKGLAKYICIIQGFIGWFLLSLFLVALLNQTNF
ncbi:hypothetical protein [Ekhidna sp.]|uniref:hypothetical protein n=1 Tax=Ekhidna sp. TaxID=2608089 RepID=UPI003B500D22